MKMKLVTSMIQYVFKEAKIDFITMQNVVYGHSSYVQKKIQCKSMTYEIVNFHVRYRKMDKESG